MSDIIRRRAFLGTTRNTDVHECLVEYEFPRGDLNSSDPYANTFGQSNITKINWPEGVEHIFKYAFINSRITSDSINSMPDTVKQIDTYAFSYLPNLSGNITLPSSLEYLGDSAFTYCTASSVTFQSSEYLILGPSVFSSCSQLGTITLPENLVLAMAANNPFSGTLWYTNKTTGDVYLGKNYITYKNNMPSNTNLTLESGTLSIAASAFSNKTQLKSIVIPDTVQFIGNGAFSGCTGLTSITIPKSLSRIIYAGIGRTQVNKIEVNTTSGAGGISFASPFYSTSCTGITTVNWNAVRGYGGSGTVAYYDFLGGGTYLPNVTEINFGSEVIEIPNYICSGLKKITSVTIPSSAKYIGSYAFYQCTGLTSITFPENIEKFNSAGTILGGCTGITTLNYNAISARKYANEDATSPSTNTNSLWGATSNLTTVNIGNQVQVIPSGFLGSGQSKVTSITIPSSVTTIDYGAFYYSKLTSIDLPSSVTLIRSYAFANCTSLTSITIRATTPPTLDPSYTYSSTFPSTSQNYTIYVPASAVDTYKNATRWSNWASKIQAIPS